MKALILAGGSGMRLRPQSAALPKCLLQIHGHTILDYQLRALAECGISDIAIVTGHLDDKVREHVKNKPITLIHNPEYPTTNSAYGIWISREWSLNDPEGFLVINADLIFQPDMLRVLLSPDVQNGIIIDTNRDPHNDQVKIEMIDGHIRTMHKIMPEEKISAEAVGPVKFSRAGGEQFINHIRSYVEQGDKTRWCFYLVGEFAQAHSFRGIKNPGLLWAEIDTVEDLERARSILPPQYIRSTVYADQ